MISGGDIMITSPAKRTSIPRDAHCPAKWVPTAAKYFTSNILVLIVLAWIPMYKWCKRLRLHDCNTDTHQTKRPQLMTSPRDCVAQDVWAAADPATQKLQQGGQYLVAQRRPQTIIEQCRCNFTVRVSTYTIGVHIRQVQWQLLLVTAFHKYLMSTVTS